MRRIIFMIVFQRFLWVFCFFIFLSSLLREIRAGELIEKIDSPLEVNLQYDFPSFPPWIEKSFEDLHPPFMERVLGIDSNEIWGQTQEEKFRNYFNRWRLNYGPISPKIDYIYEGFQLYMYGLYKFFHSSPLLEKEPDKEEDFRKVLTEWGFIDAIAGGLCNKCACLYYVYFLDAKTSKAIVGNIDQNLQKIFGVSGLSIKYPHLLYVDPKKGYYNKFPPKIFICN